MVSEEIITIKNKIVSGVFALTSRNILISIFSLIANFILTILLEPEYFGIFFVVSAVISFLSYFSDIGLAAALIQKKAEPTRRELVTVFTIQQILVILIILIVALLSPFISGIYKLNSAGSFLLYALLFSFFLSSLKTIPSILLERKLEFGLLAIPQVIETLVYYLTAIILAKLSYGIYSFAWAAIARGLVGLIIIYMIERWPIGLGLHLDSVKNLISFGIPFQTNSLLALVKDDLLTLFLGGIFAQNKNQLGYIGWAKKWAESSLRVIMDSIVRVTFPAFARLQDNKDLLGRAIEKVIFYLALFIFPTTAILILFMKSIVYIVPKYSKWEPALFSFYLFAGASIFSAFSSPLVNALNSIGKIKKTLLLMIMWTSMTWLLVPVMIHFFGYNGVAMASLLIALTGIIPILMMRRIVFFHIIRPIMKPLVSTILFVIPVLFILQAPPSIWRLIISLLFSLSLYSVFCLIWMKGELATLMPYLIKAIKRMSKWKQ